MTSVQTGNHPRLPFDLGTVFYREIISRIQKNMSLLTITCLLHLIVGDVPGTLAILVRLRIQDINFAVLTLKTVGFSCVLGEHHTYR